MEIRQFHPSDVETLADIDQACFPPGISYTLQALRTFITQPNSMTWVAVEGKFIIGFLIAEVLARRTGHIITIDVVEEWRRRGVGKALMVAAEDWAQQTGMRVVALETAEDNHVAQRFYRSRGYGKVDTINHYYSDGAAAWVMVKRLDGAEPPRKRDSKSREHRGSSG